MTTPSLVVLDSELKAAVQTGSERGEWENLARSGEWSGSSLSHPPGGAVHVLTFCSLALQNGQVSAYAVAFVQEILVLLHPVLAPALALGICPFRPMLVRAVQLGKRTKVIRDQQK